MGNGYSEILLGEGDIQQLTEFLAGVSSKWEEIGIAVGLPKHIMGIFEKAAVM